MKNDDLDFAEFAAKIIKSIDDMRSFGINNTGMAKVSSKVPTESRVNAFYRLLGLPSVLPDIDNVSTNSDNVDVDNLNTGNNFKASDIGYDNNKLSTVKGYRESFFKVTDGEVNSFLNSNVNKVNDGAYNLINVKNPDISINKHFRRRGPLFPMVVFGEIKILPQDKRVSDAFMPKQDRTVDIYEYKAPLIESIILMRLKGDGVFDATMQEKLKKDFEIDSGELNSIESMFIDRITRSTHTVVSRLSEVAKNINSLLTKKYPKIGVIGAKNFVAEVRLEFDDGVVSGDIDKKIQKEDAAKRLRDAAMFLIEYEDNDSAISAKDSPLMSDLLSIVGSQQSTDGRDGKTKNTGESNIAALDVELNKAMMSARSSFRELEFLLGTFSGLSGVDVIVVMEALFRIPIDQLIGLLNNDAKGRLYKLRKVENNVSVKDAISTLENTVTIIYNRIVNSAKSRKVREK